VKQAELMGRIDYALAAGERAGLPLTTQHRTPISSFPVHDATDEVQRLMIEGVNVCPSAFPAVPVNRRGVRFTITLSQ
jgi:7-keto-8-aminopelargonate synthetase-like enzyme